MSIDFTIMYATHDAFPRDLTRLATAAGHADAPGIHAGWANFNRQLHVHHTVEDAAAINTLFWERRYRWRELWKH
ncbi:hypothetical protein [Nocardia abscessus]|uniref:hypothetical protein n=1 Tax=Nocardia abscessus TaxID=120957 RepID=UPI0024582BF3|nr:hypothetical protein [Nocardia abscessus]